MGKKKNSKVSRYEIILGVLTVIILILIGLLIALLFTNKNLKKKYNPIISNEDYKINQVLKTVEILNVSKEIDPRNSIYQDKLVTYDDLSDATKIAYAYNYNNSQDSYYGLSSCDHLEEHNYNGTNLKEICEKDPEKELNNLGERIYYTIDQGILEQNYYQLFNNFDLPNTNNYVKNNIYCSYSGTRGNYICFKDNNINTNQELTNSIKTEITDVYITEEEIIIYEKYMYQEYNSTKNQTISYFDNTKLKKIKNILEGKTYKHTFLNDTRGSFYWYSTEPV